MKEQNKFRRKINMEIFFQIAKVLDFSRADMLEQILNRDKLRDKPSNSKNFQMKIWNKYINKVFLLQKGHFVEIWEYSVTFIFFTCTLFLQHWHLFLVCHSTNSFSELKSKTELRSIFFSLCYWLIYLIYGYRILELFNSFDF